MNRKFVSKSNLVLRKILNNEKNLDILQDFIESFLEVKIKEIFLNPYLYSKSRYLPAEENFGIADVRIKTESNEEINVGIQIIDGMYIQNKMLLYYSQIHTNQLEYKRYKNIARTVTINILDFNFFNTDEYHKKIHIKEQGEEEITDNIELHVIELPKFNKDFNTDKWTKQEAWTSYLKGNGIDKENKEFEKITKLDRLLDKFWQGEKME